ncbi:MAG: S1C family serine protease [Thermoguttaceae bacterium]|nr:S1C family serine protease [Thermoguttaceae bacterium]MDW8037753.1 trypsin-like peptidase domain-containing protein [Thermoguttaceae bacterium]
MRSFAWEDKSVSRMAGKLSRLRYIGYLGRIAVGCIIGLILASTTIVLASGTTSRIVATIAEVQPKMVKIFGAGGFRGLEHYQSGMLISDQGHILTVWSHVLDTDEITVVLHDGRRYQAKLLGADARLEIAVLKIQEENLPHFKLQEAVEVEPGTRILAFSNLFNVAMGDEPVSVQRGIISVRTHLSARRGGFETLYNGPVYVIDAVTNNPGAAGGAVVTYRGELVGMIGKEVRNTLNNTWLNYAVPIESLRPSVEQIITKGGMVAQQEPESPPRPQRSLELGRLGIVLVPDILPRTPPYVDWVREGSPAQAAGIKPDDLIILLNDRLIHSCQMLQKELEFIEHDAEITLTLLRGLELIEVKLKAPSDSSSSATRKP